MSPHRIGMRPWAAVLLAVSLLASPAAPSGCGGKAVSAPTVADVQPVHVGVSLAGLQVRKLQRVVDGSVVETADDGRARVRLDDGTSLVVAGNTKLAISAGKVTIEKGRVFVLGAEGARTEVILGDARVMIAGAHAAIRRTPEDGKTVVYAASGEVAVTTGGKDSTAQTGESATISGTDVKVAPERSFDDWTGGLASPWGASGKPSRAVGELWGRDKDAPVSEVGTPLTIRSQNVEARVVGESVQTVVTTTFFHAGDREVDGDFRMAIPEDAIVAGFGVGNGGEPEDATIELAAREGATEATPGSKLEWAGDGWVRGMVPGISPGALVTVTLRYVEWLQPEDRGRVGRTLSYRYPLAGEAAPPIVGEFSARIDATAVNPLAVWPGQGASVKGGELELRKSDFRATADLVTELEVAPFRTPARMYIASAGQGDDAGDYLLVRAEAPGAGSETGVALALVLDTSASVDAAMLDTERAFVESILGMLGPRDQLMILQADETTRPVGPEKIGPLDDARRKAIVAALGSLNPAGATDIGRAIEAGADVFDVESPTAMVVYVGDGWPTVGDAKANDVRARLARRTRPMPRLGAVAVGPVANRFGLTALVRGSGPVLEVEDRADAASQAALLVSDALQPMVPGVELALGPEVEQVYPLEPRSVRAGDTVFAVGRLRGTAPKEVRLRWRDAKGVQEQTLMVSREASVDDSDVARRWASARVEELVLRGSGREAITDVAIRTRLLTPWTAWVVGEGQGQVYTPSPLPTRVLDLSAGGEGLFSAELASGPAPSASLLDFGTDRADSSGDGDGALKDALKQAAGRVIDDSIGAIRTCRDSRASLRPDLSGALEIKFKLDGGGRAGDVRVDGSPTARDDALFRCVSAVIVGLSFPAAEIAGTVEVVHTVALPPGQSPLKRKCSATSELPVALRRGVWLSRLGRQKASEVYLEAKRACELPTWSAKRAMLEIVLGELLGLPRVELAQELEVAGESDAAAFLRQEALKRARDPNEVKQIRASLLRGEIYPSKVFEKAYLATTSDDQKLAVLRRFLGLAPHDVRLRRQLIRVLESKGDKEVLRQQAASLRRDPYADATLLADCASALRRAGDEAEARRAFAEIVERAPSDPWARAYAADRLRNEGWFDTAAAVIAPLERQLAGEPAVTMRTALANEGAGRVDVAARILAGLTQSGGRSERERFHDLASDVATVMLLSPHEGTTPAEKAELERRALELPRPARGVAILVRAPAGLSAVQAKLVRGPDNAREERDPDAIASELGLLRFFLDPDDTGPVVLELSVPKELPPSASIPVHVYAIVSQGLAKPPTLISVDAQLPGSGDKVSLGWKDGRWAPQ